MVLKFGSEIKALKTHVNVQKKNSQNLFSRPDIIVKTRDSQCTIETSLKISCISLMNQFNSRKSHVKIKIYFC